MGSGGKALAAVGIGLLTGGLAFAAMGAIGAATLAPIVGGLVFTVTTSLVMGGAKSETQGTGTGGTRPEELTINTATEARPIPVVFGICKIGGNLVRYDKSTFKTEPVYETPEGSESTSGGKGGIGGAAPPEDQKYLVGYNYFLSWDVAYCVGPVDRITAFWTQPGEKNLLKNNPEASGNATNNPIVFDESTTRVNRDLSDGEYFEGNARFYSGAFNQSRFTSDDYDEPEENHRNVCFVHFRRFQMGRAPAPGSCMAEIRRLPRALDAAGDPISGFRTRGSTDSNSEAWDFANPAAAMFEILTNNLWGAAVPHEQIDVESFKACSQYFAANDIGLCFVLSEQDRMSEAINLLRDHVQTILVWSGEQIKMVCLMDRSSAYTPLIRITRDMVNDVSFSRPTWPSTVNEIRINFVNRAKNHRTQTVVLQDLGSIEAVGRIQSKQFDLLAYPSRRIATRQARRILKEASYPQASLSFKMNRIHSGMEAGAFVMFVWPDWTNGEAITFWRVSEIRDDQTESGELEISLIEDTYAVAYEGDEEEFQQPDAPFEEPDNVDDADVDLGDDHSIEETGEFGPGIVLEPDGVTTGGVRRAIVLMQRRSGYIAYATWTWATGASSPKSLPAAAPWASFMTLDVAVPITRHTARNLEIDATLEHDADAGDIIDAASFLELPGDHYSDLTASSQCLLIVGREIMRIGWAEDLGGGAIRLTGILRGVLGSEVAAHSSGATAIFVRILDTGYFWNPSALPVGEAITFTADQVTVRGSTVDDTQITFSGPEAGGVFSARSVAPPRLEPVGPVDDTGGDWSASYRVRAMGVGAGTTSTIEGDAYQVFPTLPAGVGFYFVGVDSVGDPVPGAVYSNSSGFTSSPGDMPATLGITRLEFIPGTGEPGGAILELEATPTGAVATGEIRVYTLQGGTLSLEYVTFAP